MASSRAMDTMFPVLSFYDALQTEFFRVVLILHKINSCTSLCEPCRMTLIRSLLAELRPRAPHRIREQDFHNIRVDFDLNGAPHVTSRDCPIPLPLDTALRLRRYEDPQWWPGTVRMATDLLRDDEGAETEWSLKLWYALDGVYTAGDAVLGVRTFEAWEEKFALFVHASVCTAAAADDCVCPARREVVPTHSTSWTRNIWIRRARLGPLMRQHAPGLDSYLDWSSRRGLDDAIVEGFLGDRRALMCHTQEYLGQRGEWILGRMEQWVTDQPEDVFSEDNQPDVLDDTYDLDAVKLNTDDLFSDATRQLREDSTDVLDGADARRRGRACRRASTAKDDPLIYPHGILRPVPLTPEQAHMTASFAQFSLEDGQST